MKCFRVAHSMMLLALLLLAAPRALAAPQTFTVATGDEACEVKFTSKAAMESFDGKTRMISGRVTLDPAALGDSLVIAMDVDMTTLDTGIALRNRHMRENHLHTEQFPTATFAGAKIVRPPVEGDPLTLEKYLKSKSWRRAAGELRKSA